MAKLMSSLMASGAILVVIAARLRSFRRPLTDDEGHALAQTKHAGWLATSRITPMAHPIADLPKPTTPWDSYTRRITSTQNCGDGVHPARDRSAVRGGSRDERRLSATMQAWLPPLVLLLISGTGAWVYRDATRLEGEGSPVLLRSQYITLDSPRDWTTACIFGWVLFFPLYLSGRRHDA